MSTYEAGQVCIATVKGRKGIRVMRSAETVKGALVWASSVAVDGNWWFTNNEVTDIRPLVVLDLDVYAHIGVQQMLTDLRQQKWYDLADAIEAQLPKPRIPEPGLWGVVEAHTGGNHERRQFGRIPESDEQHWLESSAMGWFLWSDLIDPILIRDGIEDEQ